jgi:hypothetical protein
MKVLKGVLYFILIMVVATLLAALFAPSKMAVSRKVTIDKESEVVYRYLVDIRKWQDWDPWFTIDSIQTRNYNGSVRSSDYGFSWKSSHPALKSGAVQVLDLKVNEEISFDIDLSITNQRSAGHGLFTLKEQGSQTVLTWAMVSEMDYPHRLLNYFMKQSLGLKLELGLQNLKNECESTLSDEESESRPIENLTVLGREYLGIRVDELPLDKADLFFANGYSQLYTHAQIDGVAATGPAAGLIYSWDMLNNKANVVVAIPTSSETSQITRKVILGSDTAWLAADNISCTYIGGYSKGYKTHNDLNAWIDSTYRKIQLPVIESYLTGPRQTADSNLYKTKVTYHF